VPKFCSSHERKLDALHLSAGGACGTQTRDHLFKECAEWRGQQKTLWAEVRKETGRGKRRWKVRDLLADEICSRAVLDFIATTDVGRRVPAPAEKDAQGEASEWELRERREREEERRAEAEELGTEVEEPQFPHARFPGIRRREVGGGSLSFVFLLCCFFVNALFPWCDFYLFRTGLGGGQWEACNAPPSRGQRRSVLHRPVRSNFRSGLVWSGCTQTDPRSSRV
jgi:hypothetical protein